MAAAEALTTSIDGTDIHKGMEVFASDGTRIGSVREVWVDVPAYGFLAKSTFEVADYGPVRGTSEHMRGAEGFVQVSPNRGIGLLGSDQELFVPLRDLEDAYEKEWVVTRLDGEDAISEFANKPDSLVPVT